MPLSRVILCLTLLGGCASHPDAVTDGGNPASNDGATVPERSCTADAAALTVRCVLRSPPVLEYPDDEWRTDILITFAAGAFDGASRPIDGESDHVVTEFFGNDVDASMTSGLAPGSANDSLVTDVLIWHRMHLLHDDVYERVTVTGTVDIDASGHGTVDLSWSDAPSGRGDVREMTGSF